jgi:hypothetical protein
MLAKHNIRSVALPPRKIFSYFPPMKDTLGLRTPGVYSIPCERGRVYIGQSGQSIQLQIKDHDRHIRLAQTDKSAVAEHSINHELIIKLHDTKLSLLKPDTWIESSGKPLNLKCTHTKSTEKMA